LAFFGGKCLDVHDEYPEALCGLRKAHQRRFECRRRIRAPTDDFGVEPVGHVRRDLDLGPDSIDALGGNNYKGVDLAALVEYAGVVDANFGLARTHLEEIGPVDLVPGHF